MTCKSPTILNINLAHSKSLLWLFLWYCVVTKKFPCHSLHLEDCSSAGVAYKHFGCGFSPHSLSCGCGRPRRIKLAKNRTMPFACLVPLWQCSWLGLAFSQHTTIILRGWWLWWRDGARDGQTTTRRRMLLMLPAKWDEWIVGPLVQGIPVPVLVLRPRSFVRSSTDQRNRKRVDDEEDVNRTRVVTRQSRNWWLLIILMHCQMLVIICQHSEDLLRYYFL